MPEEKVTTLMLEDFLPYRLSVLTNAVSAGIADIYQSRFDLSVPEWRVIAILARFPGSSAREVAERTLMDKVAVSRAVSRLLASGRVARSFGEEDRRRSILELTATGREVHRKVAPLALDYEARLTRDLSTEDRRKLMHLLTKLTETARAL